MAIPIEKPDPTESDKEQQSRLDALHAEQDRVLRESGIAEKAIAFRRRRRQAAEGVAAGRQLALMADSTPDITDPNVTFVAGRLERKIGTTLLTQLSVLFLTGTPDETGRLRHEASNPVPVAVESGDGPLAVDPFDPADAEVVDGLLAAAREAGIPDISDNLLRLNPAQSPEATG